MLNPGKEGSMAKVANSIIAAFMAVVLAIGLMPIAQASAQALGGQEALVAAPADWQGGDELPAWAQDTGEDQFALATQDEEVSKPSFDLRTRQAADGQSVVTPVKIQSPFSSCWSFGGIAAAEASIRSEFGDNVDLSEKHLAWFAMHPVGKDDDATQVGEGVHVFDENKDTNPNAAYIAANPVLVSTLFSSGVGPIAEDEFPYKNNTGRTELDYMKQDPQAWKADLRKSLLAEFQGDEAALNKAIPEQTNGKYQDISSYVDGKYSEILSKLEDGTNANYYTKADSWWVDDATQYDDGTSRSNRNIYDRYTLRDGNLMPDFNKVASDGTVTLNDAGMRAVKQELLRGRGVACAFCADTSVPGQLGEPKYINTSTWAHYTYTNEHANHAVCIVGWDDNYSKDNFIDGTTEDGVSKTPPGNGAWLCKNSWGSLTGCGKTEDDQVIGKNNWGVDGSGYFYISYYDKSIARGESLAFSDDHDGASFFANQHDYMPAVDGFLTLTDSKTLSSANVFTAEADQQVKSVSTTTDEPGARVTFAVYRLGKNAQGPTDGILVGTQSATFEYAGFHRLDLKNPFYVHKGERFAVTSTVVVNSKYQVSANASYGEAKAKQSKRSYYCESVVNEGESYLYNNGRWIDWAAVKTSGSLDKLLASAGKTGDVVDNFSIKAYGVAWDGKHAQHSWDAGTLTTNPTATKAGVTTYTCPTCGATKTAKYTGGVQGAKYKVAGNTYKVTSRAKGTVTLTASKNAGKAVVPAKVSIGTKAYNVTGIASGAFAKAKKVRTVVVKSKKLTKKSVRNCLASSKVKTIKVNVGNAKTNKSYVKKYAPYFAKKNSGSKTKVAVKA